MAGRFLLDTNIVIALFSGDAEVVARMRDASRVFVASVVLGELHYGAQRSAHAAENAAKIERFAQSVATLPCDDDTARMYGSVKNGLRARGTPIPENDIWLAAVALQHGAVLVTRDQHFDLVETLSTERW